MRRRCYVFNAGLLDECADREERIVAVVDDHRVTLPAVTIQPVSPFLKIATSPPAPFALKFCVAVTLILPGVACV